METKGLGIDGSTDCDQRHAAWDLAAEPRTASRARALTAGTLRSWHVTDPDDLGDIVLMVDELVTNAVVHGTGLVRLHLTLNGPQVIAEIGDGDPTRPAVPGGPPRVLDWAEAGRGLLLVATLATEFGARPDGTGKTVWFARLLNPLGLPPATALAAPPGAVPLAPSDT
ncbi:ATP-binding protein [Actinomadura roseirufa]|uniref:ATP-binding protein n=1 Tax=Actinomadura roseirufa TaxID=2094049 RepID=UPI001040FE91|nr:ATP-binding protein [Actinomadura roseirufa]